MKNKELVTELAARMGWTAQEVAETLSVQCGYADMGIIVLCFCLYPRI